MKQCTGTLFNRRKKKQQSNTVVYCVNNYIRMDLHARDSLLDKLIFSCLFAEISIETAWLILDNQVNTSNVQNWRASIKKNVFFLVFGVVLAKYMCTCLFCLCACTSAFTYIPFMFSRFFFLFNVHMIFASFTLILLIFENKTFF